MTSIGGEWMSMTYLGVIREVIPLGTSEIWCTMSGRWPQVSKLKFERFVSSSPQLENTATVEFSCPSRTTPKWTSRL